MNKSCMILPLLLVLLTAGLTIGQVANTANNTSIVSNNTSIILNNTSISLNNSTAVPAISANESILSNESASAAPVAPAINATAGNETDATGATAGAATGSATAASAGINLNYIWSFSGIEPNPITMVLEQSASDLFGRAKYEPDSGSAWNADVIGSVAGDKVDLTMSAQKDNVLTITKLSGIFANEAIAGNFTQVSEGKMVNSGTFTAMWINPDTSSYTPAAVEVPEAAAAAVTPAPVEAASSTESASDEDDETETEEKKSRFVDVREYRDKIGPGGDLSGVPPGMGGVGL